MRSPAGRPRDDAEGAGGAQRVALAPGRWVCLRALRGHDEESVAGRGTLAAVQLLDRLLVDGPGTCAPPEGAAALSVTDRDLLLAAVYRAAYGPRVDATVHCTSCAAPFDVDFDLDALVADVLSDRPPPDDGLYTLPGGRRFRLPTAEDEFAVLGLEPEAAERALLARCLLTEGDPGGSDDATLAAAVARAAPALDVDLPATCPECGGAQTLRFQLQDYLLGAIAKDGERRLHEIHLLAQSYAWGLDEILSLSRQRRRGFAALCAGESPPRGLP